MTTQTSNIIAFVTGTIGVGLIWWQAGFIVSAGSYLLLMAHVAQEHL